MMINWIVVLIVIYWIILKRFSKDGKVEGQPLGLPKGTMRALTTLLIILFPFTYILTNNQIPGIIINAIFILIAFYFEARKSDKEKLKKIIKEVKSVKLIKFKDKENFYPLYLPKYTVRFTLIVILVLLILTNILLGSPLKFEATNTLIDILMIIGLYIFGTIIRGVLYRKEHKRTTLEIIKINNYKQLEDTEIGENITSNKMFNEKLKGKTIFSILMFISIVYSLLLYNLNLDISIPIFEFNISLRALLLLSINLYFGFRD